MKSQPILILAVCLLALSAVSAMPQRRAKSQRQVEYSSTPYPAAGFRPRVPFNLPGEVQPKIETEPLTTTSTTSASEVETLENTEPLSTTEQQQPEAGTVADLELSIRTPANTYGAPEEQDPLVPDTVVVVAQEPARDFQPPPWMPSRTLPPMSLLLLMASSLLLMSLPWAKRSRRTMSPRRRSRLSPRLEPMDHPPPPTVCLS